MARIHCNIVYYEPRKGTKSFHSYWLWASDWEDKPGWGIATIIAASTDAPEPKPIHVVAEAGGAEAALEKAKAVIHELGDHANWSKFSDCP